MKLQLWHFDAASGGGVHSIKSPSQIDGGLLGGARWDDRRDGAAPPTLGAAAQPMCQLDWRSGCNEAERTFMSSGG